MRARHRKETGNERDALLLKFVSRERAIIRSRRCSENPLLRRFHAFAMQRISRIFALTHCSYDANKRQVILQIRIIWKCVGCLLRVYKLSFTCYTLFPFLSFFGIAMFSLFFNSRVTSFRMIYSTLIQAKDNANVYTFFVTRFFEETLPTMIHYSYYSHDFILNDSSRECIAVQIRFNAAPLDKRDARTQSK